MNALPTRRDFMIGSAAAAAVAVTLTAGSQPGCSRPTPPPSGRIDTHTHFYDPTRPQGVPWPGREDTLLHRPILPDEFDRMARPLGVTSTVVVEASPWLEDNAWVLGLADRHPSLIGLVGHLNPGTPEFASALERFGADPRFRGIRIGSNAVAKASADASMRQDLQRLAERNMALDVLVGPDQLGPVAALAKAVPGLRIVIDHCANIRVDGQAPPPGWATRVRECAAMPGVAMKVSGLVEGTGRTDGQAPMDVEFYRPVLETVWKAFGPDRVLFGSNWPVSARFASYATVVGIVEQFFAPKGTAAADRFFTRNAMRIYGLRRA